MSDRKYRQRGYQDEPGAPRRDQKPAEKKEYAPRGQPPLAPKTFSMPGFREVVRCARCGNELTVAAVWSPDAACARCGTDLHACAQCAYFDTGSPFECQQPIPSRVSPKTRNNCTFFEPRTTVGATKSVVPTPRAFDDLWPKIRLRERARSRLAQ
jgi:hypothetical protein